ncbi:hypothetical protein [Hutsoniella sourekii]|uniref:hypothetical protein n=1 Tax=Hutsoniella sourekii TaxID=87650 RepID=UPI00048559B9|nr:hypothetical protein [Hutsoniella sourekii]
MMEMQRISRDRAELLARNYKENPEMKYVVYNIRRRSFILHNPYVFFFRFSRRESVWNTPIVNLDDVTSNDKSIQEITQDIREAVNQQVYDTVNLNLKKKFTLDDGYTLLRYYFHGKCYLAYYDYYLGRVVLIKERDKSEDFSALIGTRYYFIDDMHNVIQNKLGLESDFLIHIVQQLMEEKLILEDIDGIETLNEKLHQYICNEIDKLETYIQANK